MPEPKVGARGRRSAASGRSGADEGSADVCPAAIGVLDDAVALEDGERVAEALVVAAQRLAKLAAEERPRRAAQGREDPVGERRGRRSRRGAVVERRVADDLEVRGGAVGARDELELDGAAKQERSGAR